MTTWAVQGPWEACQDSGAPSSIRIANGPPYSMSYQVLSSDGCGAAPRYPMKYNGGRLADGLGPFFRILMLPVAQRLLAGLPTSPPFEPCGGLLGSATAS